MITIWQYKIEKKKIEKISYFYKLKKKIQCNIFILDLFSIYKGYKHLLRLPTNGQRTRSNKKTAFFNNLILQNLKFFIIKKINLSNLLILKKKRLLIQLKFLWIYNWKK